MDQRMVEVGGLEPPTSLLSSLPHGGTSSPPEGARLHTQAHCCPLQFESMRGGFHPPAPLCRRWVFKITGEKDSGVWWR